MTKCRNLTVFGRGFVVEKRPKFDVVIIGGGPAGMSAALWCSDLGLRCLLIEKSEELGGQLHKIHNPITNYPGLRVNNGREMLDRFLDSLSGARFERLTGVGVASINPDQMTVSTADGRAIRAKAIIIATGVSRRRLGVPGEEKFRGKGILESGAKDRELTRGKRVVIVGGGDAAIENALMLSEYAASVIVVHRRSEFSARQDFMASVNERENVTLLRSTKVLRIGGADQVEWVEIADAAGRSRSLPFDHILIRIGVEPNSEFVNGEIELDDKGYIRIDPECRTNRSDILAIGDVACPLSPTISTATGTGTAAAKAVIALI